MTTSDLSDEARAGRTSYDPESLTTPEQFATALTALRESRGMSIRELSRATQIPPATLGGYFSGRHLPPLTQPQVLAGVLAALGVADPEPWRDALRRVRRVPGPRARGQVPYRGLEPFGIDDADWFFGRQQLVAELLDDARAALDGRGNRHVTVLVGASGSGKSSILRAGVLAQLRKDGVPAVVLVPGADPGAALARALEEVPDARVIVVDQFEEVFGVDQEQRTTFLQALFARAATGVVLLAVRADFYSHVLAEPMLLPLLRDHQRLVGAMTADELREAIVAPAVRAGGSVAPELIARLLRELAPRSADAAHHTAYDAGSLPLLQYALLATWRASAGGALTTAAYATSGGIEGAIRQTAEEVYAGLDDAGRDAARLLFSQLVSVDDEGIVTRRRTDHADLAEMASLDDDALEQVIAAFVARRILTAGEHTLDISHEALLETWPRLREWIAQDRDDLRIRRRVTKAARAWEEYGREDSQLLGGTLLDLAGGLLRRSDSHGVALSALERTFVEESAAHAALVEQKERRRVRRLQELLVAVAVLALLATGLAAFALRARAEADDQRMAAATSRDEALSRQVAIQAEQVRETDPSLAMQLALAAQRISPTVEANSALLDVTGRAPSTRIVGPEGTMRATASPDGKTIAIAGVDGKVRLFATHAAKSPTQVAEVPAGTGGALFAAAWSPDGSLLAAGGIDGGLTVFDVREPAKPTKLAAQPTGPKSAVQALDWSEDGTTLAAAASDPALFRWHITRNAATKLPTTTDFAGSVNGVALAKGLVATASSDGTSRLWIDPGHGPLELAAKLPIGTETNYSWAVAFSPDRSILAVTAKDRVVRLWDIRDPHHPTKLAADLGGFDSWVNGVAFSHDGQYVAAAASAGLVQVWKVGSWELVDQFRGSANFTWVEFVDGDRGLLTSAIDGVARRWSLAGPRLDELGGDIWSIVYSGDGKTVLTATAATPDKPAAVRIIDASDPRNPRPLPERFTIPESIGVLDGVGSLSPDGTTAVGATSNGRVVFWRRQGGAGSTDWKRVGDAEGAGPVVIESAMFSADGTRMATAADDGTVSLFDTSGDTGVPERIAKLDAEGMATTTAFTPDAGILAVSTIDKEVRLWSLAGSSPKPLKTITGFDNYVYGLAISRDGKYLAAAGADKTVRLFRLSGDGGFEPVGKPLRGPRNTVFSLAFAASGDQLSGASQDGALWVWDLHGDRATLLARLRAGAPLMYATTYPPAGSGAAADHVVAGAGSVGTADFWLTSVDAAADYVCAMSGSPITKDEWEQYVPGAAFDPPCA